jgi:DivIVA domain-containing protein
MEPRLPGARVVGCPAVPDDHPTISSSRLSASEVARHTFGQARRGFDPHEVRSFLESVSRELQAWEQREHDLRAELADAEERALHPVLDEATLSTALGQQSANVLRAAHDEAGRIVTAAEEEAATVGHQAQRRAAEVNVSAETASAERIAQAELAVASIHQQSEREARAREEAAHEESERILARAREQGRALVERAQLARREVLADLAQRRRDLHLQIEQFRAARDELAATVLGVRGSVDDIVSDLIRADDDARAAAAEVARRPQPELEDLGDIDLIDDQIEDPIADPREGSLDGLIDADDLLPPREPPPDETVDATAETAHAEGSPEEGATDGEKGSDEGGKAEDGDDTGAEDAAPGDPGETEAGDAETGAGNAGAGDAGAGGGAAGGGAAAGDGGDLVSDILPPGADPADAEPGEAREAQSVEDLFARIRAARERGEGGRGETGRTGRGAEGGGAAAPAQTAGRTARATGTSGQKSATGATAAAVSAAVDADRADATAADADADAQAEAAGTVAAADAAAADTDSAAPAVTGTPETGTAESDTAESDTAENDTAGGAVDEDDPTSSEDRALLRQRADLLDPVVSRLTRRVKRALQDDQNRLLDKIRNGSGKWTPEVLGPEEEHAALLVEASSRLLKDAYVAGAAFAREHVTPRGRSRPGRAADQKTAEAVGALAGELASTVTSQLRRRLEIGAAEGAGGPDDVAELVGVAYREWRGERIERLVGDMAVGAFSSGVLSATEGSGVRWLPANGGSACPDCDDNSLAGSVSPGLEFPTGHAHPPAHAGCRCLVTPTSV